MEVPRSSRTSALICYSSRDSRYVERLQLLLKPLEEMGRIDYWDVEGRGPEARWSEEFAQHLKRARIVLLMLSPNFLAADSLVENSLPPALKSAELAGCSIFLVRLATCAIETTDFARVRAINQAADPLADVPAPEQTIAWQRIAEAVKDALAPFVEIPQETVGAAPAMTQPSAPRLTLSRRKFLVGLGGMAAASGGIVLLGRLGLFAMPVRSPVRASATPSQPVPVALEEHMVYTYHGHRAQIDGVAWSPDGMRLASGSADGTVQLWDALSGDAPVIYRGHTDQVNTVKWSWDGKRLASGSGDKLSARPDYSVQVWEAAGGKTIVKYRGHSSDVNAVAWSPDGGRVASASADGTVQVWDAATGASHLTYRGHQGSVTDVAWMPQGNLVASGGDDQTVRVWDGTTGELLLVYWGHHDGVTAVSWSPDGAMIASASYDDTVQVWNAYTGQLLTTFWGQYTDIHAVAWSPDGKRIASGGYNGTVQVWDAASGDVLLIYQADFRQIILALGWAPDNTHIASGGLDGAVRVWQTFQVSGS
jgi:WD40 repeat protein